MKIYSYRYMWRLKGSDSINFKIVTDTLEGLKKFEDVVVKIPDLLTFGKEYLNEYDVSLVGCFTTIFGGDNNEKV